MFNYFLLIFNNYIYIIYLFIYLFVCLLLLLLINKLLNKECLYKVGFNYIFFEKNKELLYNFLILIKCFIYFCFIKIYYLIVQNNFK